MPFSATTLLFARLFQQRLLGFLYFLVKDKNLQSAACLFWGQFYALAATSMHSSDTVGL